MKTHIPERRKRKIQKKTAVSAVLWVILFAVVYIGRTQWVQNVLLPGDSQVTGTALNQMVQDLRAGESFEESFEAFCREIIDNAAIPG